MTTIEKLTSATIDDLVIFNDLLKQLSSNPENRAPITLEHLNAVMAVPQNTVLVIRDEGKIIGTGTLIVNIRPTGRFAFIEDVVVDSEYRGRGLGEELIQALIETARKEQVAAIELTSRPKRIAANKLYQKVGFQIKETNYYEMDL